MTAYGLRCFYGRRCYEGLIPWKPNVRTPKGHRQGQTPFFMSPVSNFEALVVFCNGGLELPEPGSRIKQSKVRLSASIQTLQGVWQGSMPTIDGLRCWAHASTRGPKDHINIRIPQTIISGIPFYWTLGPERQILVFMRSFGPLSTGLLELL